MIYKCVKKDLGENILNDDLLNYILWSNGILTKKDYEDKIVNDELKINDELFLKFANEIKSIKDENKKVVIVGDYDVDGVCSTSIMFNFLKFIGVNVDFIIPNRFINGYGLKKELVDKAITLNADVIITVDNGISAKEAIDYALTKNLKVIVTDHHTVNKDFLPTNCLIVNPQLYLGENDFKDYCGSVVAVLLAKFYVQKFNVPNGDKLIDELEELAGIATIADVMPLYKGNRRLVKNLLNKIKTDGILNTGLRAVLTFIDKDKALFDSEDLGFSLAPILNAPGRLNDATIIVKLLTDTDFESAKQEAFYAFFKNRFRKDFTNEALQVVNEINLNEHPVNVVYIENLGEGIIGLVSGKITESTGRPSLVFTKEKNGHLKGSGRSPLNYDLINGFKRVIQNKVFKDGDIIAFGGHKGAMGLTIKDERTLENLRALMCIDYLDNNTGELVKTFVPYEIRNSTTNFLEDYYNKMELLQPFGEGFEKGILGSVLKPLGLVKSDKNYYSFYTTYKKGDDEPVKVNFFYFSSQNELLDQMVADPKEKTELLVLYTPSRNKFNDKLYYKGNVTNVKEFVKHEG